MALLGTFGLNGALDKILTTGDIEAPEVQPALEKLLDSRKAAMEKVLKTIDSGPRLHHSTAYKLVNRLLDNSTVTTVLKALPALRHDAQNELSTQLNTSTQYDPHLLLPFLRSPLSTSICKDLLTAHRRRFRAARLLAAVAKIDPDLQDTVFELIYSKIDETALAEAIALSHSKDAKLRQKVTSVISEFDNPAAHEALTQLLNDSDATVRLHALRGLVKIQANLPAAELFNLMAAAKKEEAPLVKALISASKDPQLLDQFLAALLSSKGKAKSLGIIGLAELINAEVLHTIFRKLADKPEATRSSLIQSLSEAGGEKFLDAANTLVSHTDADIQQQAASTFIELDSNNSKVRKGMIDSLSVDIPVEIKREYIEKLGEAGETTAIATLLNILNGAEKALFAPALDALNALGDQQALSAAFEALNHKDADIQSSALKCLVALTPGNFAARLRDQLLDQANYIHEDVVKQLVETVETLTTEHKLKTEPDYSNTLTSLKQLQADEFNFVQPGADTDELSPFGDDEQSAVNAMFGEDTPSDNVFGVAEDTEHASDAGTTPALTEEEPAFKVELVEGLTLNDRYELIREIGRGGYGSVWLIRDTFIQEELVMKFLHQQLVSDEIAIERFIRELRLARKITHKNIIRLFDYLDLGQVTAISMEYFDGAPLSKLMSDQTLEIDAILKITSIACEALHSAHEANVIHRDMKPANILVNNQNEVKIVDFGIAAASKHAESRLTRTGTLIGTPTYISPEQIQGKEVDARTDIYSLGIILYEMLTGAPPYQADDPMALIFQHVEGNARRIEDVNPLVSTALADVVHRSICPDPDDRFQSMLEFQDALAQVNTA